MGAEVVKRRRVPKGWHVIDGGEPPSSRRATEGPESDPVIDQTRSVARQLFASDLSAYGSVRPDPLAARLAWIASSSRRRDRGMVDILERIDLATFAETWTQLVCTLQQRGARGMLDWLESERGN